MVSFSVLALATIVAFSLQGTEAAVSCEVDDYCASVFREGSKCVAGKCTNPFYYGGCLQRMLPDWHKTRVCGSEDPPEAEELGYCRKSPFFDYYPEVRLGIQNWESSYMLHWIFQIILSEILEVPVSVELGVPGTNADFYNVNSSWDWGTATNIDGLIRANEVKDCRNYKRPEEPVEVKASDAIDPNAGCANLLGEVWKNNFLPILRGMEEDGIILRPTSLGVSSKDDFVIPDRTAIQYPEFATYHGLQGNDNRERLAEVFLWPTTWLEYCEKVSPSNCTSDDSTAARPPETEGEGAMYYAEGLYTGHFRAKESGNCTENPECSGIFIDYPCEWSVNTVQKLVWFDIPLEPVQFTYGELLQINLAANYTKAHTIGYWWKPDPLHELWSGTDSQLTQVHLPPATQECLEHRNGVEERCLDDLLEEAGSHLGACEDPPNPFHKVVATVLRDLGRDPNIDKALWSPAHLLAERFEMSNIQYNEIFKKWLARGTDKWNYDLRDATCEWVVEHLNLMQSFAPESYPRTIQEENIDESKTHLVALALSGFAMILIILAALAVNYRRNTKVMYHTQLGLIYSILLGLLMVAIGALILVFPSNNTLCAVPLWMVNLGYAIELFPVAVKVDAINNKVNSGNPLQHVRLSPIAIRRSILVGCILIGGVLVIWMLIDAPQETTYYELSEDTNDFGETIIFFSSQCLSESGLWSVFMLLWKAGVLGYALVLVGLANRTAGVNGTKTLAAFLTSHSVILAFRVVFFAVGDSLNQAYQLQYQSVLLSLDCIMATIVFVGPKLVQRSELKESGEQMPDLFVETTIVMANVAGFTKWASMREPGDVFRLLEKLFSEFDKIVERRRLLKVEVVRDCYVAVSGCPKAQKDHALQASRFAIDCMSCMHRLLGDLEVQFGPDTSELTLRIGLHSGTCTGGFLRGKGARFQLFGDTMNAAGVIEKKGKPGKIHLSEAVATRLREAGKESWIQERDDKVLMPGKGSTNTYWLVHRDISGVDQSENGADDHHLPTTNLSPTEQRKRLVRWNAEVLLDALRQIVAVQLSKGVGFRRMRSSYGSGCDLEDESNDVVENQLMPFYEVREIIFLPPFDRKAANRRADVEVVEIPDKVVEQLTALVDAIASKYNDLFFHNFSHASHVVMAVTKYLARINAAVDAENGQETNKGYRRGSSALHDHTYGISSDPLTQFAIIFSALIHDLDHPGVPNTQLIVENKELGLKYKDRSVAEQNSFDLAWDLLMEDRFNDLRETICPNQFELNRFRALLINAVLATDLGDKDLKALRNNRWEKAFSSKSETASTVTTLTDENESIHAAVNRKATIVIEHLIQAADIAHTCQHWHVYRQWNFNLFREMYAAYKAGRADQNPADFWYDGEIGFFDYYIIPLSQKLADCGVFGVSSDENLSYATANRAEWVEKGHAVVAEYLQMIEEEEATGTVPEQSPEIL